MIHSIIRSSTKINISYRKLEIRGAQAVAILLLPVVIPVSKMRWRQLNYNSREHYIQEADQAEDFNSIEQIQNLSDDDDDDDHDHDKDQVEGNI